jgi:hypothetical protein
MLNFFHEFLRVFDNIVRIREKISIRNYGSGRIQFTVANLCISMHDDGIMFIVRLNRFPIKINCLGFC